VIKSWRTLEAFPADRAGYRQWQRADAALTAEPGQLGLAPRTQRMTRLAALVAELTVVFEF